MNKFFSIDSPLMVALGRIMDLVILSFLWLICSIPVITAGSATAALDYVTLKLVRGDEVKVAGAFFHSFKTNLKQGIVLTLIFLILGGVLFADYFIMSGVMTTFGTISSIIFLAMGTVVLNTMFYTFPLQAQFVNTIRGTLKNAFFLSVQKISNMFIIFIMNMLPLIALLLSIDIFIRLLPLWLFFAPAGIAYVCSIRFVKIFEPMMKPAEPQKDTEE